MKTMQVICLFWLPVCPMGLAPQSPPPLKTDFTHYIGFPQPLTPGTLWIPCTLSVTFTDIFTLVTEEDSPS